MPETTETATFDRPAREVFLELADFSKLAEWDPMFEESSRVDAGELGEGARFRAVGSVAGKRFPLDLTIVTYDEPHHVVLEGTGEGLSTTEDIRVEERDGGCEVTYRSAFQTDKPDLVDALSKPGFVMVGKRALRGMKKTLERE